MNPDCKIVRDELALSGSTEASEAAHAHVSSCSECASFLEALRSVDSGLKELLLPDVSDEVVATLLARKELASNPERFRWSVPLAALATAASLVFATSLVLNRGQRESTPRESDVPDVMENQPFLKSEGSEGSGAGAGGVLGPADELRFRQNRENAEPEAPPPGVASEDKRRDLADDRDDRDDRYDKEKAVAGKKDSFLIGGRTSEQLPAPTVVTEPVYPEIARNASVQGTVVLEIVVDRDGNVTEARVIESVPLLDQAAIDAVREWKYPPAGGDTPRVFRVPVVFELPRPEEDLSSLLEERSRIEGLRFQEPRGYWANTYLPGDPMLRQLARRIESSIGTLPALHQSSRPSVLPFDPSSTSALSLFVSADRRGISSKSRLLVQVGIRARDHHGRRRPPMNLGVVLHSSEPVPPSQAAAVTALVHSLASAREAGDRFRLVLGGNEVPAEEFSHGRLSLALGEWLEHPASNVGDAFARTLESVHAGDDPDMPLGTSVVIVVSGERLDGELDRLLPLAGRSALGGVSVSTVGFGSAAGDASLARIALAGRGRRYDLEQAEDASGIVDRELGSAGRAVARALRLRIQLSEGVRLVGVLGSERLNERAASRVRAEERSIDARLQRNLGITADRGEDEDGIQIVIPTFYAGDAHSILLDVVADGPGPIAEVTARYKDLVQLDNTVARARLSLPRSESASGPLQASVVKDYLGFRLSEALRAASECLERDDPARAMRVLDAMRTLLAGSGFSDPDLGRDIALLDGYIDWLPRISTRNERDYFASSLLYASALKRLSPSTAAS